MSPNQDYGVNTDTTTEKKLPFQRTVRLLSWQRPTQKRQHKKKKKGHRTNPIATTPQHPRPFSLCFYVRRNGTIARVKPSSRLCTYQKVANISDFWICREMSRFSLYFRSVFFYIAHQSFLQYTFHIFPKIRFSISDLLFLIFLIRLSYISNQIGTIFCKTTAVGPPTSAG